MAIRGGGLAALALIVGACAQMQAEGPRPNAWSPDEHAAALSLSAGDPWCGYMRELRSSLTGEGAAPGQERRAAELATVREEAAVDRNGDPLWPYRKAMMCELIDGAAEERREFDWDTTAAFLAMALEIDAAPQPEDGVSPLVAVYDHLDGGEAESLEPVDLSTDAYCADPNATSRALSQQRGGLATDLGFPGSLRRAPDWFALSHVAYNRWAREQVEGHQIEPGPDDFGGIPYHCSRFHAAYAGAKEFAVKDNLIFLLPELDDPTRAGRLEVLDAEGNLIVLDEVLAAAQLNADGTEGESIDFFPEDLAASGSIARAVDRTNDLPPPKVFQVLFDEGARDPIEGDSGLAALKAELMSRAPSEPLRVALTGQADCVGDAGYNKQLSVARARSVFNDVIRPTLIEVGFDEEILRDKRRFKLSGVGEAPSSRGGPCVAAQEDRRVVVVVQ